ncbi:hypothetical protein SC206_16460 [Rouxiella sp. T17]|uniref:hypothetical protein n=1 Tax=Rouxiella sp. T17 TaxID=3085684 RepID=UPI002FCB930F
MKQHLKTLLNSFILAGAFFSSLSVADDAPRDLGLLPLDEQATVFKQYDLATEGTHYYDLWCGTSKNDDGYSIQYNYFEKNHPPVGAKFSGGEDAGARIFFRKDISVDSVTHSIVFKGIGRLNAKLTKLTLESGVVKPCSHEMEYENLQNDTSS